VGTSTKGFTLKQLSSQSKIINRRLHCTRQHSK